MSLKEYLSELGIGPRRFVADRSPVAAPANRPEVSDWFVNDRGYIWRWMDKYHTEFWIGK